MTEKPYIYKLGGVPFILLSNSGSLDTIAINLNNIDAIACMGGYRNVYMQGVDNHEGTPLVVTDALCDILEATEDHG